MLIAQLCTACRDTEVPDELLEDFLQEISSKFSALTYNLLTNNCNNFSDEMAQFLVGQGIPAHITGLPAEVAATPFGQMIMPMLQPALEERLSQANATQVTADGAGVSTGRAHSSSSDGVAQQASNGRHAANANASTEPGLAAGAHQNGAALSDPAIAQDTPVASSNAQAAIGSLKGLQAESGNADAAAKAQRAFQDALAAEYEKVRSEGVTDEEQAGAEAMKRVMVEVGAGLVSPPT